LYAKQEKTGESPHRVTVIAPQENR
jgi:hypothetical protein